LSKLPADYDFLIANCILLIDAFVEFLRRQYKLVS